MTTVVNLTKEKHDIYIGRPSKWGNPFVIGRDGTRKQVIQKYKNHLLKSPYLLVSLGELKNKKLGCYCKPAACHGDVLAELTNQLP